MPTLFLLDTNAYFHFFRNPKTRSQSETQLYTHLVQKLQEGGVISFYISEITSMEIHSVLGKYRRGSPAQRQQCEREIVASSEGIKCSNVWVFPRSKPMKPKVFRDMQKLISDIEASKGSIQAAILRLDQASIDRAKKLLLRYADRYNLGSHDALVGGSLIVAREKGMDLTLITSDRGFKAVLREESIPFYDPTTP